jgi:rhamnosyltransferase
MSAPVPDRRTVGGVIVTYFPDPDFGSRLTAIAREVGSLIVVDNSASPEIAQRLRPLCAAAGAEFIASATNAGLGAALNTALRRFEKRGTSWVVAFDQDSTPAGGFVSALLGTAAASLDVAVVGANWTDEARPDFPSRHLRAAAGPWLFERPPATADLERVTCVITSGSLIHLPTWHELGGFEEDLFLDLVDTDYCLRVKRAGREIRVAAGARLQHRRGSKQPVTRFGRTWWPAFMPPSRLRLLFRNRLRLFRRHAWHAPHWVAFELVYAAKIVAEVILLEDRKAAKLGAMLRGTWDGLLGRGGP